MIYKFPNKNWNWRNVSANSNITIYDILKHKEFPWDWKFVFQNKFTLDKQLYADNQYGRLLVMSIFDDHTGNSVDGATLSNMLLVFHNDYVLYCIMHYI